MSEFMVQLSQDQSKDLQQSIYEMARQAVEQVRTDAGLSKPYLNKGEACKYVGISRNTLKLWINLGLKVSIVNGITLISKDELNRFILSHQK